MTIPRTVPPAVPPTLPPAIPRIGVSLPTFGREAGPEAVALIARTVERLGFHSVSASERLLLPASPAWVNEFGLPDSPVLDPIEALTWAAAHTTRVRMLTAVVNALFQPPLVLARRLATLDHLSRGRLDAGLGQGWLAEEFVATGVPISRRGAGFEEHIAAMRACWGPDPVQHDGVGAYVIPPARIGPKPFNGEMPILIGAASAPAITRAARLGAGFIGALWDRDVTAGEIASYRSAGGRGPIVLLPVNEWLIADQSADRVEIRADVIEFLRDLSTLGADEVHWGPNAAGISIASQVGALEALAGIIEESA